MCRNSIAVLCRLCTLLVHACFHGVFIVGFGGVVERTAEAGGCHDYGWRVQRLLEIK